MKLFNTTIFTAILGLLATTGFAGTLELCNQTSADSNSQDSYQPFNGLRGQLVLTGTGSAPSITLPALSTGMRFLRIDFQNRNDFLYCMDTTPSNNWCGSNPPTTTVSNTAWVFKQASVKVLSVSKTIPTALYVSGTGTTGYSMCGMQ